MRCARCSGTNSSHGPKYPCLRTGCLRQVNSHDRSRFSDQANPIGSAQNAYQWTGGHALFARGSPFAPVTLMGRTHRPYQANNAFIFPGIGLGALVSGAGSSGWEFSQSGCAASHHCFSWVGSG
ncbi:MAG: malic enzyme-like NAD(P)-binding protein [Hylemonella sp.]